MRRHSPLCETRGLVGMAEFELRPPLSERGALPGCANADNNGFDGGRRPPTILVMETLHTIAIVFVGLCATVAAVRLFARQVLGTLRAMKEIAIECGLKKTLLTGL
jgi:hypothetical protein